jgi:excinuclease UvrABC nuclease subunit
MLELDSGLEFDAARDEEFFAALPARPGVLMLEMTDAAARPYLARTADIRRAAERLLRAPEGASKRLNLRSVVARVRYRVTGSKFEQTFTLYQNAREKVPDRYRDVLRLRRPVLLKVNLRNEYPRCYVTRGLRGDDGFYFGPFASRRSADAFGEGFLDLFKIRRCQIKIRRDPNYAGCIYSEMKMCLAPCFAGCTKEEYDVELGRVLLTLETTGDSLKDQLERERETASDALNFEQAAAIHKRLEKVSAALWGLPEIARRIEKIDAVILQRAAEEKAVAVFPVRGGVLSEPIFLNFGEQSSQPRSVEAFLRHQLEPEIGDWTAATQKNEPVAPDAAASEQSETAEQANTVPAQNPAEWRERYGLHSAPPELSEHLSMVARWFYSKPRDGEIFFREKDWPYRRILRACSRLLQPGAPESEAGKSPPPKP